MNEYIIMTDSSCDLPDSMAKEMELEVNTLSLVLEGKEYVNYLDGREIGFHEYYDFLREGKMGSTSAANIESFRNMMEPILKSGKDLLYLGFSSGLSGTYNAGLQAANELSEKYPERKIYTVDTLAASLGEGLLVYYAAQEKKKGKSIEEVRDCIEKLKLNLCHWFTVNDLHHLKRGGRVSATTAIAGTILQIKPVMHVDDDGKLINVEKARGRRAAIKRLADIMAETAIDPAKQTVFISHGDCIEDAEYLASMIRDKLGVKDIMINYVGPVIGTHSGPGTLALFFIGKKR
ncbi:MAG: DegV family protein [Clostridia bacterium]|nr:DegV family protein [Clostridia bacterium]